MPERKSVVLVSKGAAQGSTALTAVSRLSLIVDLDIVYEVNTVKALLTTALVSDQL